MPEHQPPPSKRNWPAVIRIFPLEKTAVDAGGNAFRLADSPLRVGQGSHQSDDQELDDCDLKDRCDLTDRDSTAAVLQEGVITIGNFDGVHLGHATLLREVRRLADELGGPALAVVLDPHPAEILNPAKAPKRLTWIERRAELMDRHGIDLLVVCRTTPAFLNMTAEVFFQDLVCRQLRARAMVEGPNFFFGRHRGGDIKTLGKLCEMNGVDLQIVEPRTRGDDMVSSTRIRRLLEQGKIETAVELLGGSYQIRGRVVEGVQRGREIGFPTANLDGIDVLIPGPGVYGGYVTLDGKELVAAIHVGPNPTFDSDDRLKVEIHLLDYHGDLYGQTLFVDIVIRVRDIIRFDSAQSLIGQLNQDINFIRSHLDPLRLS